MSCGLPEPPSTVTVVVSVAIITTTTVVPGSSKHRSKGDDQSEGSQDVVDNGGNIAADSNSMEGLGSVPLLSRGRITQRKALE